MNQISSTATVRAPLDRVWETIADVGTIAAWHPGVENSPVLSDHRTGLGALRRVELYDGSSAVEASIRMTRPSWPPRKKATAMRSGR